MATPHSPRTLQEIFNDILGIKFAPLPHAPRITHFPQAPAQPVQDRQTDFAQYLLSHSFKGPKVIDKGLAAREGALSEEPSFLNKVFDVMSIPLYGAANVVEAFVDPDEHDDFEKIGRAAVGTGARILGSGSFGSVAKTVDQLTPGDLQGSLRDFADKNAPKITGQNILHNRGVDNKVARYGGGLALDFAIDPASWVPGLNILGAINKARKAKALSQGFRETGSASQQLTAKAAVGGQPTPLGTVPATPTNVPKLPGLTYAPAAPARPRPQVTPIPQLGEVIAGGQVPSPLRKPTENFPRVPIPGVELGGVSPFTPQGGQEIGYNILNSPEDFVAMQAAKRRDNALRANNARWKRPLDWHEIPDATPQDKADIADNFREGQMAARGQVSDGRGNSSVTVTTNVIEAIKRGDVPRHGALPKAAEGEAAVRAVEIADEFTKNLGTKVNGVVRRAELKPENQANLYNRMYTAAKDLVDAVITPTTIPKAADWVIRTASGGKGKDITERVPEKLRDVLDRIASRHAGNDVPTIRQIRKEILEESGMPLSKTIDRATTHLHRLLVSAKTGTARPNTLLQGIIARQMLRTAEDHLIGQGNPPIYHNGMRLRLSDVLEEVGLDAGHELPTRVMKALMDKNPHHVQDPVVRDALNTVLARRSLSVADLLSNLSTAAANAKRAAMEGFNYNKAQQILNNLPKAASEAASKMGLTDEELTAVADHVRNFIDIDKVPLEKVLDHIGRESVNAILEGRVDADLLHKANKAIIKQLNTSQNKLSTSLTGIHAIDTAMSLVSTWVGRQREMKQYALDIFNWKEQNAYARGEWLRAQVNGHTRQQIVNAMHIASKHYFIPGLLAQEQDQATKILAGKFIDYFDTMLSSSGFNDVTDMAGTAAVKSQMIMKDVNKHLNAVGSKFQFVDSKNAKDFLGNKRNYSANGDGWIRSWELVDPQKVGQDPISFMYDLDLAIERTTAEYSLYDSFAMHFGAKKIDKHFDPKIHTTNTGMDRLQGYYFHKDVADEFKRLVQDNEKGLWVPTNKAMRFYSQGLRAWKTGVTIYYPSHHIRNLIGDTFLMWAAGHNNPLDFIASQKVLFSQRRRYQSALKSEDLRKLEAFTDPKMATFQASQPETIIIRRGKHRISAEQIYLAAHQHGLLLSANKHEDIFGVAPLQGMTGRSPEKNVMDYLSKPFGGHARKIAGDISEYREHYVRLAHFIAATKKGLKKSGNLEKVFDDAAAEVRKWHPDGRDLTPFEQKYMRNVMPFYSWTRKAVPLVVQTAVTRPSKVLFYPRAQQAMQGILGIEEGEGLLDPFPEDQQFPDWIRSNAIGPIGDPLSHNAVSAFFGKLGNNRINIEGQQSGYSIVNPSNPFQDIVSQFGGMGRTRDPLLGAFEQISPAVRIPTELAFGAKTTGAPIPKEDSGPGEATYLAEQVPLLGAINRVLDLGKPPREQIEGGIDQEAIINMFTALGLRGTGPYEKSAEFEADQRNKLLRQQR